jgi:hypothetical protein
MKQFKIRASKSGELMTGTIGLTEIQEAELEMLTSKPKRTDKQEAKMAELIAKKQGSELPKTLRTMCEDWVKAQLKKPKRIYSKYLEKGNVMEESSIESIAEHLELGMVIKNEEYFEDDYFTGTPDLLLRDIIIDAKNSWSLKTFPLFSDTIPDIGYMYQVQVYMHLTGRKTAKVAYFLSNTPENLIEREARMYCNALGFDEVSPEILSAFTDEMTYDEFPSSYRIKHYSFEYDPLIIEELKHRVVLCREYIEELKNKLKIE